MASEHDASAAMLNDLFDQWLDEHRQLDVFVQTLRDWASAFPRTRPRRSRFRGLRSALTDLASSISERFGIHCELRSTGSVKLLDNFSATHLYRIAQEAVNNAIKHGGSKRIELPLEEDHGNIRLNVLDDGAGIGDRRGPGPGMGLRIMDYHQWSGRWCSQPRE